MTDSFPSGLRLLQDFIHLRASNDRPEEELLPLIAANDPAAFEVILRRHGGMVLGVCRRQLDRTDEVEDAFQAVFLVLLRKANSLKGIRQLGPWLFGVAIRVCRHARTRRRSLASLPEEVSGPENTSDLERREVCHVVDGEIQNLPPMYRDPIVLCHLQGHTREEAARLLGLPLGTVATRVRRGLERLRQRLERSGVASLPAQVILPASLVKVGLACLAAPRPAGVALAAVVLRSVVVSRLLRWGSVLVALAGMAVGLLAVEGKKPQSPSKSETPKPQPQAVSVWSERLRIQVFKGGGSPDVLAFSPDAKTLAVSGSPAGIPAGPGPDPEWGIQLFASATGKRLKTLTHQGAQSSVQKVAFSSDGKALFASETALYRFDLKTGKARLLAGNQAFAMGVATSADGKWLAVPTAFNRIHLVNTSTGRVVRQLVGKQFSTTVAFVTDNKRLASVDG